MAADSNSVKCDHSQIAGQSDEPSLAACEPRPVQSGTTWSEYVAKVGDLKMPGDGFAEDLKAIQAAQGLDQIPEWPD